LELAEKIKISLDETRMLILGAQILVGFQYTAVFREGFENLPAHAQFLNAAALALMIAAIGLLIEPSIQHRIVDDGEDTPRIQGVTTTMASAALLPFAVTLGLDLYIVGEKMAGMIAGLAGGVAGIGLALTFWYGIELAHRKGRPTMTREGGQNQGPTPVGKKIEQMLTEARVILPGAQALFGFQLTVILAASFDRLPPSAKAAHAASIGCIALAVVLLMAPAAYHRIVYGGEDDPDFHRIGSRFVLAATIPLALGLSGDLYVVIGKIAGSHLVAAIVAAVALAGLIGFWHVYPAWLRRERQQRQGTAEMRGADSGFRRLPTAGGSGNR
jgi:Family of unknown function (DUF6328)